LKIADEEENSEVFEFDEIPDKTEDDENKKVK
jgi:hypothetical protein